MAVITPAIIMGCNISGCNHQSMPTIDVTKVQQQLKEQSIGLCNKGWKLEVISRMHKP